MTTYDVCVIGGGTAGPVAAIQAARAGARTLLVEKNGVLGGTMTTAGVAWPALFYAWGRPVIAGIGWEVVKRAMEEGSGEFPDFSLPPPRQNRYCMALDYGLYAALLDEAVIESGAELLLHTMVAAVEEKDDEVAVTLCDRLGLREISCKIVIDCTGDALAVQMAGFEVEREENCQPATPRMRLTGYQFEDLDIEAIERACGEALESGELRKSDFFASEGYIERVLRMGSTNVHVTGICAVSSEERTRLEVEGRRRCLKIYRFLRRQPGLEKVRIRFLTLESGVRETVRIRGLERITLEDYTAGRMWDEAVCYSFYPVDLHGPNGEYLDFRPLEPEIVPTIPRGALIPAGSRRFLVAGRCLSSDQLANSGLRVQAPCMAMGQAAGALGVLAIRDNVSPAEVDMNALRVLLKEHGALVPEGNGR
ncbi:FAD-dependent oxidoreductase [bacterium]|nr:FAD-dependent oxidoreductase [bacterium]